MQLQSARDVGCYFVTATTNKPKPTYHKSIRLNCVACHAHQSVLRIERMVGSLIDIGILRFTSCAPRKINNYPQILWLLLLVVLVAMAVNIVIPVNYYYEVKGLLLLGNGCSSFCCSSSRANQNNCRIDSSGSRIARSITFLRNIDHKLYFPP